MMKHFLLLFLLFLASMGLSAQKTFTEHLTADKAGQGRVRVYQSADVEAVVNGVKDRKTATTPEKPQAGKAHKDTLPTSKTTVGVKLASPVDTPSTARHTSKRRRKASGFRIQIYTGGNSRADRVAAERAGRTCRAAFPELAAYTHFLSPRWVCRVGDFATQQEASEYASKLRQEGAFREVRVVKSIVWLP